jgi:hypothetical protein
VLYPPPPPATLSCSTNACSEVAPSFCHSGHSQSQPQARWCETTAVTPLATSIVPDSVVPPPAVTHGLDAGSSTDRFVVPRSSEAS